MPELPEVETVKVFLNNNIINQKIFDIKVFNKKLRYDIPSDIRSAFNASIISKISRRGKYLIFLFKNEKSLLIHLGMTGCFRISKEIMKRKHDHLMIDFGKKKLFFNDIRKFGFIKVYDSKEVLQSEHLRHIGPEPLGNDFNFEYIFNNKKNITIKSFLMNQKVIAGLGNIYCSEILYDSLISPKKNVKNLSDLEILRIVKSTKKILKIAISKGGSSIKNFNISDEVVGYFKNNLKVYGRENLGCKRCKNEKIKKIIQNGRSSFYCINCQL